ncbi:heparinase II/III family protein [Marinicauda salina]|uniref:heparinase II/III family protein n=1 Tax=Marinicauda salina TaxID=2135793 RepID=UPI001E5FB498|nr:heparinase II/III family protein [Marinicauda salina]
MKIADLAAALQRRTRRELSDVANALSPYRLAVLSGRTPSGLAVAPRDLRAGDKAKGAAILSGRFALGGETMTLEAGESVWTRPAPSRRFAAALHGFDWLRDLLSVEEPEAAAFAETLVDDWIAEFGAWNWFAWDPAILGRRIGAWIAAGEALFGDAEPDAARRRLASLARQTRRLRRTLPLMAPDRDRLTASINHAMAAVCLDAGGRALGDANALLASDLTAQILPDGGHVSRNPETAADALIGLVTLEEAAVRRGVELHGEARRAIDRLAPMVRFFRMPDGGLAAFHGGGQGDARAITTALEMADGAEKTFEFAPHSGYHRAEAAGAVVVLDAGGPARGPHAAEAHASALAFALSAPGGRIVVNCGWSADQPAPWREAVRATAAHSVLTLEETSSARLLQPGMRRSLLGPRVAEGPEPVKARRNEEDMGVWLEASHDGYRARYGLSLRRRLFLAADGGDLRGEDGLFRPVEDGPPDDPEARLRFAIRFHLHPDVRASLSRDSMSALLVLPNGDGWRFRTDGGPVRLERSVYLAAGAPPRRSIQLVVSGDAEPYGGGDRPPNRVRWAFQRLGRVGAAG